MSSNVSNDELNYAEPENSENNTDSGVTVTIDVNKGALDSNAWDKVKANVVELETAAKEGNLDISGTQIKIKSLKDITPNLGNIIPLIENPDNILSNSLTVTKSWEGPFATNYGITIASSGDSTNTIWLAPPNTTVFVANGSTITDASGDKTTIAPPHTPGTYHIYIGSTDNISKQSKAVVTVVKKEWYTPIVNAIEEKYKNETSDTIKSKYTIDGDTFTINKGTLVGDPAPSSPDVIDIIIPAGKTLINLGKTCLNPQNKGHLRNGDTVDQITVRRENWEPPAELWLRVRNLSPADSGFPEGIFNNVNATIENNALIQLQDTFIPTKNAGKIINNALIGMISTHTYGDQREVRLTNQSTGEIINNSFFVVSDYANNPSSAAVSSVFYNYGSFTNNENAFVYNYGVILNGSSGTIINNGTGANIVSYNTKGDSSTDGASEQKFYNFGKIINTGAIQVIDVYPKTDTFYTRYLFINNGEINNTNGRIIVGRDASGEETYKTGSFMNGHIDFGDGDQPGKITNGELTIHVGEEETKPDPFYILDNLGGVINGTKIYLKPLNHDKEITSITQTISPTSYTTIMKMVGDITKYEYILTKDVTISNKHYLHINKNSKIIIPNGIRITIEDNRTILNGGTIENNGEILFKKALLVNTDPHPVLPGDVMNNGIIYIQTDEQFDTNPWKQTGLVKFVTEDPDNILKETKTNVIGGSSVSISSSGKNSNTIFLAPSGTTNFVANDSTITDASGDETTIIAPTTQGSYHIYVKDASGNLSTKSNAFIKLKPEWYSQFINNGSFNNIDKIFTLANNTTIQIDNELNIPTGNTLIIPYTSTLINKNIITNNGTIENKGNINSMGQFKNTAGSKVTNDSRSTIIYSKEYTDKEPFVFEPETATEPKKPEATLINNGTIIGDFLPIPNDLHKQTSNSNIFIITGDVTDQGTWNKGVKTQYWFDHIRAKGTYDGPTHTFTLNDVSNTVSITSINTVTIPRGEILIIPSTFTMINNGTVINKGTIRNEGIIKNNLNANINNTEGTINDSVSSSRGVIYNAGTFTPVSHNARVKLFTEQPDLVLSSSKDVTDNLNVTIASSGEPTNQIFLAPSGTTVFSSNDYTITDTSGNATTIMAPTTRGNYHLYVRDQSGFVSRKSTEVVTVYASVSFRIANIDQTTNTMEKSISLNVANINTNKNVVLENDD